MTDEQLRKIAHIVFKLTPIERQELIALIDKFIEDAQNEVWRAEGEKGEGNG